MELLPVEKKRSRVVRWKSLLLDPDDHRLSVGGSVISASRAEFGLLHLLVSRRNVPMSKEFIMSWLFGQDHGRDLRQVDMFVARLHRLLAAVGLAGPIHTISGRGYAILDDRQDAAPAADTRPQGWQPLALACSPA